MASKKPKMNLGPIDDTLRKLLTKAVKKANKTKLPAKPPAQLKRPTAQQRYDARKAKGMYLDPETRFMGTKRMGKEWDRRLKADEVNERIANRDPSLSAIRDKQGRPITKKQIRDAEGKSKGLKKNLPNMAKRQKKSEGDEIQAAANRERRQIEYKAQGGKNSPERIVKRQQKRAEMRKNNKKKK